MRRKYINVTVKAKKNDAQFPVSTHYPVSGDVEIKIKTVNEESFLLMLGIALFSKNTEIAVNVEMCESVTTGKFYRPDRLWKNME